MIRCPGVPLLPGTVFRDITRTRFHKSQHWTVKDGLAIPVEAKRPGIGGEELTSSEEFCCSPPSLYPPDAGPKLPSWIAFDKKVLCFYAYFKETLQEVYLAPYQVRKVKILFYLEDGTIQVIEPRVENSGIPQGCLVSRQRVPFVSHCKNEFISVLDLNVNKTVRIYDRVYHIIGCDQFTRDFLNRQGIAVPDPVDSPLDPSTEVRKRSTNAMKPRRPSTSINTFGQFLKYDRKILKFNGYWDDQSQFGDVRNFDIYFYLADNTIEIREIFPQNSGRDGPSTFLKRGKLLKEWKGLPLPGSDCPVTILNVLGSGFRGGRSLADPIGISSTDRLYFGEQDLTIGAHLNVYGRDIVLTDCDAFTKEYYRVKYGLDSFTPIIIPKNLREYQTSGERELPPYNGWGTHEDSEGNCITVEPKAPQTDFRKFVKLDRYVLRYGARMISKITENNDRIFVISYYLSDDTISVFELAQRNSGFLGGEFFKRDKFLMPKQAIFTSKRPERYKPHHFYLGAKVTLRDHLFYITTADEFTLIYIESHPFEFPTADIATIMTKIREALRPNYKEFVSTYMEQTDKIKFDEVDHSIVSYETIAKALNDLLGDNITEHEIVTVCRYFSIKKQLPADSKRETIRAAAHLEMKRNLWDALDRLEEHLYHLDLQKKGSLPEAKIRSTISACRLPFKKELVDNILSVLKEGECDGFNIKDFINFINIKERPAPPIQPVSLAFELVPKPIPLQKGNLISWSNFVNEIGLENDLKQETS